jgi:hypothetical protein
MSRVTLIERYYGDSCLCLKAFKFFLFSTSQYYCYLRTSKLVLGKRLVLRSMM